MKPYLVAILAMVAFVASVAALTIYGKEWLHSLSSSDATVSFVDLARQANQKRDYAGAERMYQQAVETAAASGKHSENFAYATLSYAEFLRKQKRNDQAKLLEAQVKALKISTR